MTDWNELTELTLAELRDADPRYQPTNFWGPGVERLLANMSDLGLEKFKSWPTSQAWFYPTYRRNRCSALRDFDVARAMWNQQIWPLRLNRHGESGLGEPAELHHLVSRDRELGYGRAYLSYMLMLAALSGHIDGPPQSVLEIGGGFGALGEFLLSHDPKVRFVDLDIPPLLTVASYNLTRLFGDRVRTYAGELRRPGPLTVDGSAVLPNYRLGDLADDFEVFVNSYSFQEMEPDVVAGYIEQVCARGIRYAVSLNSRKGKNQAEVPGEWGALEPVTSADIVDMFRARGLRLVGRYREPFIRSAGEIVVLARQPPTRRRPHSQVDRLRSLLARRIAPPTS